jgi:hypothetical protein
LVESQAHLPIKKNNQQAFLSLAERRARYKVR